MLAHDLPNKPVFCAAGALRSFDDRSVNALIVRTQGVLLTPLRMPALSQLPDHICALRQGVLCVMQCPYTLLQCTSSMRQAFRGTSFVRARLLPRRLPIPGRNPGGQSCAPTCALCPLVHCSRPGCALQSCRSASNCWGAGVQACRQLCWGCSSGAHMANGGNRLTHLACMQVCRMGPPARPHVGENVLDSYWMSALACAVTSFGLQCAPCACRLLSCASSDVRRCLLACARATPALAWQQGCSRVPSRMYLFFMLQLSAARRVSLAAATSNRAVHEDVC